MVTFIHFRPRHPNNPGSCIKLSHPQAFAEPGVIAEAMSPLIFILSPGADPGSNLYRFAAELLGLDPVDPAG